MVAIKKTSTYNLRSSTSIHFYMSKMSYKEVFCRKTFDLAKQQFTELLSKDPLGDSVKEYLQEQQENIRE